MTRPRKINEPGFNIRVEYRVKDESLIPTLSQALGEGTRFKTGFVWKVRVSDLKQFADKVRDLRIEYDVNLIWGCLS